MATARTFWKVSYANKLSGAKAFAYILPLCLALAAHGSTNVFNDAVFWFRGGKDCVDANGYIQQGEFFDDLNADVESHANHMMTMSSSEYYKQDKFANLRQQFKENATFRSERVVFPALGTSIAKEMQTLHISDISVEYNDQPYYCPFSVNPHGLFARNNISNEYTIVSRIRLDDLDSSECLFRIGYNDSVKKGMTLGFAKHPSYPNCKYIFGYCTKNSNSNNSSYQLDVRILTNTWVDVAVVVGNDKLRVGVAMPSSVNENYPSISFAQTQMWTGNCDLLDETYYSLFCFKNISSVATSDQTHFSGSVQQMAIWKRALTDQEVMEAFGMPRPALLRIGLDNDASHEFCGERSGAAQTIDGLASWQNVANTMNAGDTWTVNFNALRDEAGLPQIFSIHALPDSAIARIEPKLNNQSLGEMRIARNGRAFWPVPKDWIRSGGNTLEIKRNDGGGGSFKLDAMELGGSLGVGKLTYSSTDDGRVDPERIKTGVPSAADPNPQHWPTKLDPSSGNNLRFRVWVDPDVADKATFNFKTAVSNDTASGVAFSVFINNQSKVNVNAQTAWKTYTFNPGKLNGGWNDFSFRTSTSCISEFGCFHLETSLPSAFTYPLPPGLSIIFR